MGKIKIAVMASGRGSNLQSIIDAIKEGKINGQIVLVLSDKADAYALKRAEIAGIPYDVLLPCDYSERDQYDAALAERIARSGAELIVLAGFMRILSAAFLDRFPNRVVNIHPALLPSFPGLHAQEQAFAYGVKVSGCTVHFVDTGVDSGPIIAQTCVPVLESDTIEDLTARILVEEHKLYPQVIAMIADGKVTVDGRKVFVQSREENR
ncbi:MAG: phosphoribosylglycinamide formyltransferase [Bacillota bacterium]|jgi:phosphoribosylglycinamide formyltransferase-1